MMMYHMNIINNLKITTKQQEEEEEEAITIPIPKSLIIYSNENVNSR